jgi:CRISPR/Cas system-associated protein Cas10 (large subunit of type III CRISPR-Cas system)
MDTYTTNSGMEGEKMSNLHQWLVCFDTDQIKQYLLATNRLKEIRGGSALIAQLDVERKNDLERRYGENNVVYSAGGGAAVLVPTEQEAQALIAKIEREFRARTVTASITGVYLPVDPTPGRFGAEMARASRELRRAKASKAELACLPVEPYMRLCDSCGNHPATRWAQDESGDWLCLACSMKREKGHKARTGFFANFVDWSQSESWQKASLPDDLDAIGSLASPPGYVGFIALDGNHVGDLLTELPTIEEYRKFSEGLWKLVQEQTFKSLEKHCAPRDGIAPFEIVLIGGDDVLLITSADVAMKVALDIVQGFEEASQQLLQEVGLSGKRAKLTMAGGVVLAHADFPIPAMHTLAEALQKSAKRLCAKQKYQTGAIDFQVVTGSDTDLDAMRQGVPHRRPYTLGDLRDLLYHIRQLKDADMPTSQLHAMYQALFEGAVKAQLASIATLGYLGRSKDKTRYNRLRQFFERFGVQLDGQLPPWDVARGKEEKRLVSALTDLVELYPFI